MTKIRIGQGYDVHRFEKGRPLIIGGVTIDHPKGLAGHSDADVLLHAISDALLGALALGDIGHHFPDTDPAFKNADSRVLLTHVSQLINHHDFMIVNIDSTIIAQAPKMQPHVLDMRNNIALDLGIDINQVSVKATTTEHLGFTGREEGIAACANALVEMRS